MHLVLKTLFSNKVMFPVTNVDKSWVKREVSAAALCGSRVSLVLVKPLYPCNLNSFCVRKEFPLILSMETIFDMG